MMLLLQKNQNWYYNVVVFIIIITIDFANGLSSSSSIAAASRSRLFSSRSYNIIKQPSFTSFEDAVLNRYACKRFKRYDETISSTTSNNNTTTIKASMSDPVVIEKAIYSLHLAQRTPSAFNTQPYKMVMVHKPEQKEQLSKYCLGPNKERVLDSDCTIIFLADKKICTTFPKLRQFVKKRNNNITNKQLYKMFLYITIFSSGYPLLPRIISIPISFLFRTAVSITNLFTSWFYPFPSLSTAETWACKQTMMVAITYMLSCSAQNVATIPMEGINARGIRHVINAPSRYAIPIIVSTGTPYYEKKQISTKENYNFIDRYPFKEMVYENSFGKQMQ